jgi:hypothetical protein
MDYAKPYKDVPYFGVWAEETANIYGARDALAVLAEAVRRTYETDLRHDQATLEALDYLTDRAGGRLPAARAFRAALAIVSPAERVQAASKAYSALCRAFSPTITVG